MTGPAGELLVFEVALAEALAVLGLGPVALNGVGPTDDPVLELADEFPAEVPFARITLEPLAGAEVVMHGTVEGMLVQVVSILTLPLGVAVPTVA